MDSEDSPPASPIRSPPPLIFVTTPEPQNSAKFDTPPTPRTPAEEKTPVERYVADPLTPTDQFDHNFLSPDLPPSKSKRPLSPKPPRSTIKRQLLMQDDNNISRQSTGTSRRQSTGTPRVQPPDQTTPTEQQEIFNPVESNAHSQPSATCCGPVHPAPDLDKASGQEEIQDDQEPPVDKDSDSFSDTDSDLVPSGAESSDSDEHDVPCDRSYELLSGSDEDFSDTSVESGLSDNEDDSELLYPGANLTVAEAVVKIMDLYVDHHWSKKCLKDTLKTVGGLLPEAHMLPPTTYQLFKHVEDFSFVPPALKFFYCSEKECFKPKDSADQKCSQCGSEATGKFFHFPLADQIKFLFEQKRLAQAIDSFTSCQNKDKGLICDICDGKEYVKIRSTLTGKYDLVLQWNVDGVSVTESSPVSMWYLLCFPCEVPPELRSSYVLVAGVWCDTKKPPMNMFLEPFVQSLINIVESGGVEWTNSASGEQMKSVVVAPILVADAPAKAEALITQYYSALYGCNTCEQKRGVVQIPLKNGTRRGTSRTTSARGTCLDNPTRNVRRFVYQEDAAPLRSGQKMDQQGIQAQRKKKPVKGVKGKAVVSEIPFFDRARSVVAEYMHSVLLGVVCYFSLLWFETDGPWCIKKDLPKIDVFFRKIQVPHFVNRPTTGGLKFKFWKASEWRSWLLYYSLPTLEGILPEKFFQHWILLVEAIYILLSDKITAFQLENASIMLRMFVRDIKSLYGDQYYTYNVHQLLHLCVSVDRWGPLSGTSAFPFESYNYILGSLIHGTKHKGQELVNQVKIVQGVIALKNYVERCKKNRASRKACVSPCRGKPTSVVLTHDQQAALSNANIVDCKYYRRAECGGVIYSSLMYDREKRKINSFVKFSNHDYPVGYAQIVVFVETLDQVCVLLKVFDVEHVKTFFHKRTMSTVNHIVPCIETASYVVVPLSQISSVLLKVGQYLISAPNTSECNL